MSVAILLAGSVAVLAGIAVLIGAIAASRLARSYDSVILKTLGATRCQILGGAGARIWAARAGRRRLSLALGLAGAWYVIVKVFEFGWSPDWAVVLATLAMGAAVTLSFALLSSLPILRLRPATALRAV